MKRLLIALVMLFVALSVTAYADDFRCKSSGVKSATGAVYTKGGCLCGVALTPASADATLVCYDNASAASGVVLIPTLYAFASSNPGGFPPSGSACIPYTYGVYCTMTGTGGTYILWSRFP